MMSSTSLMCARTVRQATGVGLLIGADLGVGDARVVIDDGVDIAGAQPRLRAAVAPSGALGMSGPVAVTLPATISDVAELGDIDMDQRARMRVFVAADRLASETVDVGQPVDPAAHEHGVHRRGRHAKLAGDLHRPEPLAPAQPHDLLQHCRRVLAGQVWGRELRSVMPCGPSARYRCAHFAAVRGERMNRVAAVEQVQPSSTIRRASLSRARGVRTALAWDTKASGLMKWFLDSSTSQPGAFACLNDRPRSAQTRITSLDITARWYGGGPDALGRDLARKLSWVAGRAEPGR